MWSGLEFEYSITCSPVIKQVGLVIVSINIKMSSKEKEAVPPPAPETGQAKKKGGIRAAIMYELTPNMNFLPLKLTWFFFTSSTFAFIPYLTIHMKVNSVKN